MYVVIKEQVGAFQVKEEVVAVVRIADFDIPSGINESAFTAKGDILVGTGIATYIAKSAGADGKYLKYDSTSPSGITEDIPSLEIQDTTNYALNGGFNFAQRQTPGTLTTIPNHKYSADRWMIERENAELQYVRGDGSSETGLTSPYYGQWKKITNAGKFLLCQPLEYVDTLKFRGKTINFQMQMKAGASKTIKIAIVELQAAGTADTLPATLVSAWGANTVNPTLGTNLAAISTPISCSVTTAWQTFQFSATFSTTGKNLLLMVWTDSQFAANDTLSIAEAGLYFGATQRSWTPKLIQAELGLCQRHYEKSYDIDIAPGTTSQAGGLVQAGITSDSGSLAYIPIPFSVSKRTAATVTGWRYSAATNVWDYLRNGSTSTATPSFGAIGQRGFYANVNIGAAWTVVQIYGHWTADAEIY